MMYVAVALNGRSSELIPALVSLFTWSKAYHCELVFSDGYAVVCDPLGVRIEKREYDHYRWCFVPLPMINEPEEESIRVEAERLVSLNPKYDYLGALLGRFHANFQNKNKWFCSEITQYLLKPYIYGLNTDEWMSPGDVWKITADYITLNYPDYNNILNYAVTVSTNDTDYGPSIGATPMSKQHECTLLEWIFIVCILSCFISATSCCIYGLYHYL